MALISFPDSIIIIFLYCCILAAKLNLILYFCSAYAILVSRGESMDELRKYLHLLRKQRNLSLKDVAIKTHIANSTLSRFEKGTQKRLSAYCLKSLAKLYDISTIELFKIAGYLDDSDLDSYIQVFKDVNCLTSEEKKHIQEQIDLFNKNRL